MSVLAQLNAQQEMAAQHVEGPALIIAGAGSGKTRVITYRIVHLLHLGVPAGSIVALTFTNKAADEMRGRIHKLSQASILACTFHSLCARILREEIHHLGYPPQFAIYDEDDSEKLLKKCFERMGQKSERQVLSSVKEAISSFKSSLISVEKAEEIDPQMAKIYRLYSSMLFDAGAVDFDDLLFLTVKLFQERPEVLEKYQERWNFFLVDEYQDTNRSQYQLIKLLSSKKGNLFVVGDPDQSIYSWRGASIQNILNFEEDFPGAKVISLEQNYRSRSNILNAANEVIKNNTGRYEKALWSERGEGEKITLYHARGDLEEAGFVVKELARHPLKECAILFRTNAQSRPFEDALLRAAIPYVIIGGVSFYQRREVKDILAYLRIAVADYDLVAFLRTINLPRRGLGEKTVAKYVQVAEAKKCSVLTVCREAASSSKGLTSYLELIDALKRRIACQAPLHQIINDCIELSGYMNYLKDDPDTHEERRDNLEQLVSMAAEWESEVENPTLTAFLESLALRSSADGKDPHTDAVRLMTLHHAKGLEFQICFIVGCEEELLPHLNSLGDSDLVEEERRLFYVGMTRAKEHLYLSCARLRFLWGTSRHMRPSRFLSEIPEEFLSANKTASEQEGQEFEVGAHVYHADFGVGEIQKTYNTSLGLTYDIYFLKTHKIRSLVARYAKLLPAQDSTD